MTDKQTIFIAKYLTHFNATRAAKEAGYSEATAYSIGSELLKKPEIKQEIERVISDALGMDRIELDFRIIGKLKEIAFESEDDFITNHDGEVIGVNKRDRLKALELLGKYRALFTDNVKVSGEINTVYLDKQDEGI